MESETMRDFVERIDEIHALADIAPGFIWRLETEDGYNGAPSVFNDPLLLINISVWQDLESLRAFVYKSMHVDLVRDKENWFDKMGEMHQALWWVPVGHIPDIQEGKDKLDLIREHGPTEAAFTFGKHFSPPA